MNRYIPASSDIRMAEFWTLYRSTAVDLFQSPYSEANLSSLLLLEVQQSLGLRGKASSSSSPCSLKEHTVFYKCSVIVCFRFGLAIASDMKLWELKDGWVSLWTLFPFSILQTNDIFTTDVLKAPHRSISHLTWRQTFEKLNVKRL